MSTPMTTSTCRDSSADVGLADLSPLAVELTEGVEAWFSGALLAHQPSGGPSGTPHVGEGGAASCVSEAIDGNLAHHRPHHPARLAAARAAFAEITRTDVGRWHLMRQVHGADVGAVDERTVVGAELRNVDALVTVLPDRPLVVLAADCLPIVLAGPTVIAAVHAGWRGLVAGVIRSAVEAMVALGDDPRDVRAVVGPGIGPCCYEVGEDVARRVIARVPAADARTRGGMRSLDLREAAHVQLDALEVGTVGLPGAGAREDQGHRSDHPDATPLCTSCGPGWFSHRRDPSSGRQAGLIVRRTVRAREGSSDVT